MGITEKSGEHFKPVMNGLTAKDTQQRLGKKWKKS